MGFANGHLLPIRGEFGAATPVPAEDTVDTVVATALPTRADGSNPKVVLVSGNCRFVYIKFGDSTVRCAFADSIMLDQHSPVMFGVGGMTHYSLLVEVGTSANDRCSVVALEI